MFNSIFYNRTIRKLVTAFGSLFSNTTLARYNSDGSENQRLIVPLAYGQKEKYWQALQGDPQNDKKVQITLPTMAFTFVNMEYDAQRKLQSTIQNFATNAQHGILTQYMPVPYNFDFELYIYVRTLEDGFQIVEQIAPFFTPDYTLILNLEPSMGISKDVPIFLKGFETDIANFEGDREGETRFVQFVLTFTVKGWLFGPISQGNIIREAITNIYNWKNADGRYLYLVLQAGGIGKFKPGEIIYQGTSDNMTAFATVIDWVPTTNRLLVDFVENTFSTNVTLRGLESNASWNLINYEIAPQLLERIDITPIPPTANVGDPFTYDIDKTYFD